MSANRRSFRTYPNPATEQLTVEASDSLAYQLTLYDMSGRVRLQRSHLRGRAPVDISHLRPGVYTVTLRNRQYEVHQRLIVR